ncbi:hypothetical protein GCE86_07880 [Micromonospora terminaliae]|uniref:Uncharacterized protein n=1 Tax=Micromonospora terminaliae TaxID=1914461 RepID=A0AAJ2ZIB8_9ACTN|nr:hypothetical protein [Micromonospora terminaliae]NES30255.1 hypothetical protein [Micromonospora terminaliae]QGL46983.1 hypothetical protein GCE86_07880 [Micromonospora terminaliae]
MFDHRCPQCGRRGSVNKQERRDELCWACSAAAAWDSLDPDVQSAIDTAIRRGPIPGLIAMRDATPPIRLPHAADLLHYRLGSGVGFEAVDR